MAKLEAAAKKAATRKGADPSAPVPTDPTDFADAKTQASILSPEGQEIKIFGKTLRLYPLAARYAFDLTALAAKVLGAASEQHGANVIFRTGAGIAEYLDDFLRLLARATAKPGAAIDMDAIVADMNAKVGPDAFLPLSAAFLLMATQNGVMKAIGLGGDAEKN